MKRALVTGASRGIGAACAEKLAAEGYEVIVNYLNSAERAGALAERIGGRAIRADVAEPEEVRAMFAQAGDVDLLVCNAGIDGYGLFSDMDIDQWRKLFAVNVDGMFNAIQCALPAMVHKKQGRIITISSMWGLTGASCEAAYSATKAAVIGLTKSLAKELGPSGIRVNCIAPGVIDTDMNRSFSPQDIQALKDETPLGIIGRGEDIAELVSFLAGPGGDFITGQVISANGGLVI
ncbi:MAG: 3-oxoacyl-ACP reductase FabG [Oscillospiraceae bacterium]|nr:3-oxoacyl-ACP reductase FabG [Oscillospiraceae bacterium]